MRVKREIFYHLTTFAALFLFIIVIFGACSSSAENTESVQAANESSPAKSADAEIEAAREIVEKMPDSALGYNRLAARYIKLARETGDFGLNAKAEEAVNRALEIQPENLDAQKLKTSLHLTFHRFKEAKDLAEKLLAQNPQDAFLYGALTDAEVELGNYEKAVEAAQKMVDLRPNMSSYSRVSHVRSLHGDSKGAIEAMALAARIADPNDKESQSWCLTHLGDEYFKTGKFAEAEKQYDAALQIFPNYHLALAGKAKTRAAQKDYENAIRLYADAQNRVPLTETVIALGDLYAKRGEAEKAKQQYDLAEVIEQKFGNTDLRRLALLWADRDVKLDEALTIAMQENANRKDIFTVDVYAWCLYKKGKFREAKTAIAEAMKLKTRDARIFYHAGMIEKALDNRQEAARFLQLALETNPAFDLIQAENARAALAELK